MSRTTISNNNQLNQHLKKIDVDEVFVSEGSLKSPSEYQRVLKFIKESQQDNRSLTIVRGKE